MRLPYNKIPTISQDTIDRFMAKIVKGGDDDCWQWLGCKCKDGYGIFSIPIEVMRYNKKTYPYKANRIAYFIQHRVDPKEKIVCHTCDNPYCCNPNHLFLGTDADNKKDSIAKGRANFDFGGYGIRGGKGSKRVSPPANTKLSANDIKKIFELREGNLSQFVIADIFHVNQSEISRVLHGKRHLEVTKKLLLCQQELTQ